MDGACLSAVQFFEDGFRAEEPLLGCGLHNVPETERYMALNRETDLLEEAGK